MAATTDYDAPRRSTIEDAETESLDAIKSARADSQSPDVDLDESDAVDSIELPGADLSGGRADHAVIPKQADEFTCKSCFLVQHRGPAHTDGSPGREASLGPITGVRAAPRRGCSRRAPRRRVGRGPLPVSSAGVILAWVW